MVDITPISPNTVHCLRKNGSLDHWVWIVNARLEPCWASNDLGGRDVFVPAQYITQIATLFGTAGWRVVLANILDYTGPYPAGRITFYHPGLNVSTECSP